MPLPSQKHTLKRSRARNLKLKDIEIREINNDIEFSEFFERLLEKTEKFISNKRFINTEKENSKKLPPNLNQDVLS